MTVPGGSVSYTELTLRDGSLREWTTNDIPSSGHVSLKLSRTQETSGRLFAFYQSLTHEKNLDISTHASGTIFDNGSYVVDHFSPKGAHVVSKFWEKHLLKGEVKQLLMQVGNYGQFSFSLEQFPDRHRMGR